MEVAVSELGELGRRTGSVARYKRAEKRHVVSRQFTVRECQKLSPAQHVVCAREVS